MSTNAFTKLGNTVAFLANTAAPTAVQCVSTTLGGNQYRIINSGSVVVQEAADPVFDGTKWVAQYSVKEYSDERKGDIRDQYADNIRNMRSVKLAECDWTQAKDIPNSISSAWTTYRQALRDVPSQEGFPFNVTWPNTP